MPTNAQSALWAAVQHVASGDPSHLSTEAHIMRVLYIAGKFQAWLNEQEGRGSGTNRTERTDHED